MGRGSGGRYCMGTELAADCLVGRSNRSAFCGVVASQCTAGVGWRLATTAWGGGVAESIMVTSDPSLGRGGSGCAGECG